MDNAKWPADIIISRWYSICRDDEHNADEITDKDSAAAATENVEQGDVDVTAHVDGLDEMMASDSHSVTAFNC